MARKPNPKIDREAPAWRVASLWGTNSKFARALGRTPSTTQGWLEKGTIDPEYHEEIIAAARRDGKKIKPDHFIDARLFAKPSPAETLGQAAAA